MVFPNLGYKKDAFLEPSLVSNISSLLPLQTNNTSSPILPCLPTKTTSAMWVPFVVGCLGLVSLGAVLWYFRSIDRTLPQDPERMEERWSAPRL